jgi:hypothetical protein
LGEGGKGAKESGAESREPSRKFFRLPALAPAPQKTPKFWLPAPGSGSTALLVGLLRVLELPNLLSFQNFGIDTMRYL